MKTVLLACALIALAAPAGAQTELRFPAAGDLGTFDPAPASGRARPRLWMSYSGVNGVAVSSAYVAAVSTRLASSADRGLTWDDTGVVPNPAQIEPDPPVEFAGMPAVWQQEVSRLVYDRRAPPAERWKLVWHRYLLVDDGIAGNDDRRFQYSWIGLRAAASPAGLTAAPERKLFAGLGYYFAPGVTAYNDGIGGPPEVRLDQLDPALADCVAFTEPGLLATPAALYVSLVCGSTQPGGTRLVLLAWPHPAGPWAYRGTLLRASDAGAIDPSFTGFSAPELTGRGRRTYLIVSPTVQPFDWYGGCLVFGLDDVDRALLRDDDGDGRADVLLRLTGSAGTFNGACGWDRTMRRSGIIYGEASPGGSPMFRMFESGMVPAP
jgi:hypothetical protein